MQSSSRWFLVTGLVVAGLAGGARASTAPGTAQIEVPTDQATIQAAIDEVADGGQITVLPGVYSENIDLAGKALHLLGTGGPAVTTIQGNGGVVVTAASGEGPGTIVEGFTITGGSGQLGGGMQANASSPVVRNCWFVGNVNQSLGGGFGAWNGASPRVESCFFTQNASERGGGLGGSSGSTPLVLDCIFTLNRAVGTIGEGGAFYFGSQSDGVLINCLVYDNSARIGGAAKVRSGSDAEMHNCTMVRNLADYGTGGFFNSASFPVMTNTILWGNVGGTFQGYANTVHDQDGGTTTISYSLVEDGWSGAGNSNQDPRFVDLTTFDLRLAVGSPCIDAGDSSLVPVGQTTDLAGQPRIVDEPQSVDTGLGSPVVDLGVYETADLCGPDGGPVVYCATKINSLGCEPAIGWSGSPELGASAGPFEVQCSSIVNFKNGLFFYGYQGRAALTFFGGTLCALPPTRRTSLQNASGSLPPTQDCSGAFSFDFGALLAAGTDPFLAPGQQINGQFWYRDPNHFDTTGVGLSNAIEFLVCPAP